MPSRRRNDLLRAIVEQADGCLSLGSARIRKDLAEDGVHGLGIQLTLAKLGDAGTKFPFPLRDVDGCPMTALHLADPGGKFNPLLEEFQDLEVDLVHLSAQELHLPRQGRRQVAVVGGHGGFQEVGTGAIHRRWEARRDS